MINIEMINTKKCCINHFKQKNLSQYSYEYTKQLFFVNDNNVNFWEEIQSQKFFFVKWNALIQYENIYFSE